MDKELTIITEPEELIAWADTFDILLNPSIEDAAILLNYMEGHDYAIGIDSDGKMYRQDIAEENGEIEPYLIDDVSAGAKPVRNPEREKPKWEDTITNRMLHWSYTPEQKEEVKKALAAGVPKSTILTYFYPEVTVEKMSSYRKKQ